MSSPRHLHCLIWPQSLQNKFYRYPIEDYNSEIYLTVNQSAPTSFLCRLWRYTTMPDPIEELRNPRKAKDDLVKYLRREIFTLNFYRAHMLYFIIVIAISSVVLYGAGIAHGLKPYERDHLTYMDALFLCASAMTTTGMTSSLLVPLSSSEQY
jgi:hypothetical protein